MVQFTKNDHTKQVGLVGRGRPNPVGGFLLYFSARSGKFRNATSVQLPHRFYQTLQLQISPVSTLCSP